MVRVDLGQRNYSQLIFFLALCTDKECVSTHQQQPEGKRYVSFLTRILSMRCQSKYVSRVVSTHINIERSVKLYKTRKTSWRGTSKSLILILLRLNIHFDKLKILKKKVFIYGCAGTSSQRRLFSSCASRGLFSSCGVRPSHRSASLVAEHELQGTGASVAVPCGLQHKFNSCGTQALLLCGVWDLPRSGIKPVSPSLAGRFLNHWATREA